MKRIAYFFVLLVAIILGSAVLLRNNINDSQQITINEQNIERNKQQEINDQQQPTANNNSANNAGALQSPIDNAAERVTKKPFGIYITPKTSPVQPERFRGYHTGTDFETTSEEQNVDVPIKAICEGKLLEARFVSGYGGVAIQACTIDNNAATVIYGHLRLSSIIAKVGDDFKTGDFLANLGTGYSAETDGERKHLHLGIHRGKSINILGYVADEKSLSDWLNSCDYVCK